MKKYLSLITMFLLTSSLLLTGCVKTASVNVDLSGKDLVKETTAPKVDSLPINDTTAATEATEAIEESTEPASFEIASTPNVEGYPIERDGRIFHKLFINGEEYAQDAYTYADRPDDIYVNSLRLLWHVGGDGICCSSGSREAMAGCINGIVFVNHTGSGETIVDGVSYPDLVPEQYVDPDLGSAYHCSLLYLEKTLGITVEFSDDRSAIYVTLLSEVDEEKTFIYDIHVDPDGNLSLSAY